MECTKDITISEDSMMSLRETTVDEYDSNMNSIRPDNGVVSEQELKEHPQEHTGSDLSRFNESDIDTRVCQKMSCNDTDLEKITETNDMCDTDGAPSECANVNSSTCPGMQRDWNATTLEVLDVDCKPGGGDGARGMSISDEMKIWEKSSDVSFSKIGNIECSVGDAISRSFASGNSTTKLVGMSKHDNGDDDGSNNNELFQQMSNNNQYGKSNEEPYASTSAVDVDQVTPVGPATSDGNKDDTDPSSSSLSTATSSPESPGPNVDEKQKMGKGKTGKKQDEKNNGPEAKRTFDQLNATEVRVLTSSIREIVKSSDPGSSNADDDEDDDYSPWSGEAPNQHPNQRSLYSTTTESTNSVYDTDKEADISAAEFDFASVIPMCKGTNISFKDRTHEDAQALLNQIINGEPDPCLGPEVFNASLRNNENFQASGRGKEEGGVVVTEVSSDAIVGVKGDAEKKIEVEEEKNVSLHNAVGMDLEYGDGGGVILSEDSSCKIVTADNMQGDSSFVMCENGHGKKSGDGRKRQRGGDGVAVAGGGNDDDDDDDDGGSVADEVRKSGDLCVDVGDDGVDDDAGFIDGCGVDREVLLDEKDKHGDYGGDGGGGDGVVNRVKNDEPCNDGDDDDDNGGDVAGGVNGNDVTSVENRYNGCGEHDIKVDNLGDADVNAGRSGIFLGGGGGARSNPVSVDDDGVGKNDGVVSRGCDGARNSGGSAGSLSDLDIPEKDENHKGSYLESVSGGSVDDSIIDSVIMENFDDGGDNSNGGRAAAAAAAGGGGNNEGLHCDDSDDKCGKYDGRSRDDNNDITKSAGNAFVVADLVNGDGEKGVEDDHVIIDEGKDDTDREDKTSLGSKWFTDCNLDAVTDEQWKYFESCNIVYNNESAVKKKYDDIRDVAHQHHDSFHEAKKEGEEEEDGVSDEKIVRVKSSKSKQDNEEEDHQMMERQLQCNGDPLPAVATVDGIHEPQLEEAAVKKETLKNASNVSLEDGSNNMAGAVCPCNSEVYACDAPACVKKTPSNHVTRLNGIREILKATEFFFEQTNVDEIEDEEQDTPRFSVNQGKQNKRHSPTQNKLSCSSKPNESNKQIKVTANKQLQTKLKEVDRNKSHEPGANTRKWTLEKSKSVLPDINNKTKSSRNNTTRGGCGVGVAGNTNTGPSKPTNLRIRKVGLTLKKLEGDQSSRPRSGNERKLVAPTSSLGQDSSCCQDDQLLGSSLDSKTNQIQTNNPEPDSSSYLGIPVDNIKDTVTSTDPLYPFKISNSKKIIAPPVAPSGRTPRNVNANKTNRFSRYTEILNNLDLKRSGAISCSATSSASTMASFTREAEDSLYSHHGDDYDNKKGDHPAGRLGVGVRSGFVSNDGGWKTPVGGRNFVPPLRRPKLESSKLYKPKRHLNPKNASAEEYHRYKMDLRLSQSLAKIKRGPPTVDCYLDPRLHNKSQTDRSRSRSQKRLPEVTH